MELGPNWNSEMVLISLDRGMFAFSALTRFGGRKGIRPVKT